GHVLIFARGAAGKHADARRTRRNLRDGAVLRGLPPPATAAALGLSERVEPVLRGARDGDDRDARLALDRLLRLGGGERRLGLGLPRRGLVRLERQLGDRPGIAGIGVLVGDVLATPQPAATRRGTGERRRVELGLRLRLRDRLRHGV